VVVFLTLSFVSRPMESLAIHFSAADKPIRLTDAAPITNQ
jgi:hypothetical protein